MFYGQRKVVHGSVGSVSSTNLLKFHTACCKAELSISQVLHLEKTSEKILPCCSSFNDKSHHAPIPATPTKWRSRTKRPVFCDQSQVKPDIARNWKHVGKSRDGRRGFHSTSALQFTGSPTCDGQGRPERRIAPPKRAVRVPVRKIPSGFGSGLDYSAPSTSSSLFNPKQKDAERQRQDEDLRRKIQEAENTLNTLILQCPTKQTLNKELKKTTIKARFDKIREWRLQVESTIHKKTTKIWDDFLPQLHSAEPFQEELGQWEQRLRQHRRELVVTGARLEAKLSLLKDDRRSDTGGQGLHLEGRIITAAMIENIYQLYECLRITNNSNALKKELVEHGIWRQDLSKLEPGYLSGLGNEPLRTVLIDMHFSALGIRESVETIGGSLHRYRGLRTSGIKYMISPEIFASDYRGTSRHLILHELSMNASNFRQWLQELRILVSDLSPPSKGLYVSSALQHLPHLLAQTAMDVLAEHRAVFGQPSAYGVEGDLPLRQAQATDFRPVQIMFEGLYALRSVAEEIIYYREKLVRLEGESPSQSQSIATWRGLSQQFAVLVRDANNAVILAKYYRGAANMTFGIHKVPAKRIWSLDKPPHSPEFDVKALHLSLSKWSPSTLKTTQSLPDLWPSLYPSHKSLPIHYVTNFLSAWDISQRLAKSRVLGVDVVMMEPPDTGPEAFKSRVNFLLIASDLEVAVVDMDCIPAFQTVLKGNLFENSLGNPHILKVGVQTELLRRTLAYDHNIDLVNSLDLSVQQVSPETYDDPTFQSLSNMTMQVFGRSLQKLRFSSAVLSTAGRDDPRLYFGHLASRPYAALQLFRTASGGAYQAAMPREAEVGLGPVIIHPFTHEIPKPHVLGPHYNTKNSRHMLNKWSYLYQLASKIAKPIIQKNRYLQKKKALYSPKEWRSALVTGYVLLTTLHRSLDDVHEILKNYAEYPKFRTFLQRTGIPAFGSVLLRLASNAGLALRPDDRLYLEARVHGERIIKAHSMDDPKVWQFADSILEPNIEADIISRPANSEPSRTMMNSQQRVNPAIHVVTTSTNRTSKSQQDLRAQLTKIKRIPNQLQTSFRFCIGKDEKYKTQLPLSGIESTQNKQSSDDFPIRMTRQKQKRVRLEGTSSSTTSTHSRIGDVTPAKTMRTVLKRSSKKQFKSTKETESRPEKQPLIRRTHSSPTVKRVKLPAIKREQSRTGNLNRSDKPLLLRTSPAKRPLAKLSGTTQCAKIEQKGALEEQTGSGIEAEIAITPTMRQKSEWHEKFISIVKSGDEKDLEDLRALAATPRPKCKRGRTARKIKTAIRVLKMLDK